MVLVSPTGCENSAIRMVVKKSFHGTRTRFRVIQVVQAKFQKALACLRFAPRLFQELRYIGQTKRDTNPW